jgi:hypothetical protein
MRVKMYQATLLALMIVLCAIFHGEAVFGVGSKLCGGSRSGTCSWYRVGDPADHFTISQARGSFYSEVTMEGPGKARAVWLTGAMFTEVKGFGRIRMRLNESTPSLVKIQSNKTADPKVFPARADQAMFYAIDVLDNKGSVSRTLTNKKPMVLSATIKSIPPYNTEFQVKGDVEFEDVRHPGSPVLILKGGKSTGVVKNPGGLRVEPRAWSVDLANGQFTSTWRIENLTGKPLDIHWFAGGIHGARLQGKSEQMDVRIDKEITLSLQGTFNSQDLGGGIVLHATSVPGAAEAEGHYPFYLQASADNPVPSR